MLISVFQPQHLAYDKQSCPAWATRLLFIRMIAVFSISCVATKSLIGAAMHTAHFKPFVRLSEGKLLSSNEISAG